MNSSTNAAGSIAAFLSSFPQSRPDPQAVDDLAYRGKPGHPITTKEVFRWRCEPTADQAIVPAMSDPARGVKVPLGQMFKVCEKPNTEVRFRIGDGDYEQTSGPEFLAKLRASDTKSLAIDWVTELPVE